SQVDKPPSCISSLPFVVNAIPNLTYISANLACVLGLAWQEFEGKQEGQGGLHTFPTRPLELLQYQGCCQLS
ncbi:unnamed protein product, partial [Porites evermanni]